MKTKRSSLAAIGVTAMLLAPTAGAAITYSYYFPESQYTLSPGGSVEVPIYLQETLDDAGLDTPLFAADNGLVYASFVLSMSNSNVGFSSFSADAAWEFADAQETGGGMYDVVLFSPAATPATGTPDGLDPATRRVLLGNLVFQANGPAGASSVALALLDPVRGILAADDTIVSEALSADVTVTVVPEPVAGGVLMLAGLGMLARRREPSVSQC